MVKIFFITNSKNMVNQIKLISLLLMTSVLFGCANNEETAEEAYINDVVRAYETAQAAVVAGNYRRAIGLFETIQSRFPFSELSNQIQMELMYAYYKSGAKEETIDQTEAFIRENPTSPNIDYALYIQALAHFEDQPDFLERTFNKDMNKRPPLDVEKSFSILERLVTRYPASEYAADAELRMVFLKNRLAAYENIVADYYIRSGAYVAALNRAKDALERYNGVPSNEESLEIMLEAYENLGMNELASDTRSVLNQNYTDNSGDSYYSNSSRIVDNIFTPSATSIAATNTSNEEISGDDRIVDNMFTSSPTSIAATNTSNEEISGDDNVGTEKEVPKFWQAIKTLLPKLPNKSN